jgi:UDP-2,4-diacetamido-2,4,6-trideoxy-beta-L-altropyranose hydrolase
MSGPVIAFRTDGSTDLGFGHIRRCLTLAQALQKKGSITRFVVNREPSVEKMLQKYGLDGAVVEAQADRDLSQTLGYVRRWGGVQALIVDSYGVSGECFEDIHEPVIVVIDDLADRPLPVDLVVNGAVNAGELSYRTSPQTRLLLGPEYALLREEFSSDPDRRIRTRVERVLIITGGADPSALTPKLIAWTHKAIGKVAQDVVVGPFFTDDVLRQIEKLVDNDSSIILHRDPQHLRDLMLKCDVAIAGGGQTTYELAATGTPAVTIRLAYNQSGNLRGLSAHGSLEWAGDIHEGDLERRVIGTLRSLAENPDKRAAMSRTGRALVDGQGAGRVAKAVLDLAGERVA